MKSAEGNVEQTTPSKREIDIQPMANLILETLAALGRPYGMNYIAQFLTADRFLVFRQPTHRYIETYGKLSSRSLEDVICVMHYLIDCGLASIKEPDYTTVELTEAGKVWLGDPQEMPVVRQRVRFSSFEKYLRQSLKEHRRDLADRHTIKIWDVITDYTLDRVVLSKPLDLDTLRQVPGFNAYKCEHYGASVVKTVQDVMEHFEDYQRANLMVRITKGSYPRVKTLFTQEVTLPEIAQVCELRLNTVCTYLRDLHQANVIDLVPWIERNINAKALYKGVEYFERVRNTSLNEAFNTLGLDYNTLLFCRLYAKDKHMQRQEAKLLAS